VWHLYLLFCLGSLGVGLIQCVCFGCIPRWLWHSSLINLVQDNGLAESADQTPHGVDASSPLLVGRDNRMAVQRRAKITMAALYAVQVFYSFFIM
jgi:hypothetical protein